MYRIQAFNPKTKRRELIPGSPAVASNIQAYRWLSLEDVDVSWGWRVRELTGAEQDRLAAGKLPVFTYNPQEVK